MAQAVLEPGSALYELAQTVDLSKVPDKLICKNCQNFLLNGFKTACCEGSICESCNTASTGKPCPLCKHEPFFSNVGKAVRGTARSYLKNLATQDMAKNVEPTPAAPTPQLKEITSAHESVSVEAVNGKSITHGENLVQVDPAQEADGQADTVVQSIEETKDASHDQTAEDALGVDPDSDDDVEITVGTYEPVVPKDRSQNVHIDEQDQGWDTFQSHAPSLNRKSSTAQPRQEQNYDNSFGFDNNPQNMDMPPEAMVQMQNFMQMMYHNGMNPQNMPFLNNNPNPNPLQAQFQQNMQQMMQGFSANMAGMQNMGMPMMGFPAWGNGMNGFPNFQNMPQNSMGNGNGFNQASMQGQGQQQFQQNFGDHRPNFNQRNGSFGYPSRGRGKNRGRGRGGAYQHNQQDAYAPYNNMPYQNQYAQNQNQGQNHFNQGSMNFSQSQHDQTPADTYATNQSRDHEQTADDNDFAPGGQEEVEEALGEEYKKKTPTPEPEVKAEVPVAEVKDEYQKEPSAEIEDIPVAESPVPQQEPEEKYIPEAYREDLGEIYSSAPPSAPLGPSAKIVAFRERGHGRFPSRGRGSFHGTNGYAPRSPARPVSQHQTNSPTTNIGPGVIGAPTGPRAMREKDAPSGPAKTLSRAESDVGIKIRGTATQPRRDDNTRSTTPGSAYDDYSERDRDTTSRRYSKYDKKGDSHYSSNYHNNGQGHAEYDEYESSRDKKRRKSSRRELADDYYDNDHEMQDTEMSEVQNDRSASHRSGDRSRRGGDRDREKEKSGSTRDKYSSSSTSKPHHKSSSSRRMHDDNNAYDDYDGANDYDAVDDTRTTSRSAKKSSSGKHDDRDDRERRDRDHERAEKDKHRKRSRHDREREEDYEDADEEESRRRSRKHKREHGGTTSSSRKDRDRDRDRDRERERNRDDSADLGLRITGRSSGKSGGTQNAAGETQSAPMVDKDPHTLEREARNRERMLKEQQRRENAEKSKGSSGVVGVSGGLSGGRTRTFKYEDEIERSLGRSGKRR